MNDEAEYDVQAHVKGHHLPMMVYVRELGDDYGNTVVLCLGPNADKCGRPYVRLDAVEAAVRVALEAKETVEWSGHHHIPRGTVIAAVLAELEKKQ